MNKFATCSALLASLFLAACGGGGGTSGTNRSASQIAVGEPAPGAPAKDEFIKLARAADCSDFANRLYIIDGKQVFWERAGNCADASYSHVLYGLTPQNEQCSVSDSIAGPRTSCKDESQRALIETITRNLDKPDLGTGRKVEYIVFPPKDGPVSFETLAHNTYSGAFNAEEVVIRDNAALAKFWNAVYDGVSPPLVVPSVDFNRKMVIGIAAGGYPNGCIDLVVDKLVANGGDLQLNYHVATPPDGAACTLAIVFPATIIVLDRIDGKVQFIKG
ncbi:hypothetical protein [Pseudoduganella sp.]|uniref:hypothetical protein n=1 Tax=Pseudoduganella sp. TaxID=1880898 RepID=UPI0035AE10F3